MNGLDKDRTVPGGPVEGTGEQDLLAELLTLENPGEQRRFLDRSIAEMDGDETALRLKEQADSLLRGNIQGSLDCSALLLHLAELTGDLRHQALGLLAEANARSIGLGEYERAIQLYDQAADIYARQGYPVEQASAQIGKIGTLMYIGSYEEALQVAKWASGILEEAEAWLPLAKIQSNVAIIYSHMGNDRGALAAFDLAKSFYEKLEMTGSPGWLRVELNRAVVLRNLGQFEASIQASRDVSERLAEMSHTIEAARSQQNMALTYFVLGRYNDALEILDQVREAFLADNRQRDAILTELFISDCLLQLRRFPDVLEKCRQVRQVFSQLGTRFEVSLAILNEAIAYAGLKRFDDALESLQEAGRLLTEQGNETWAAYAELEMAAVLLRKEQYAESLERVQACLERLESQPVKRAQAELLAARALLACGRTGEVEGYVRRALQVGEEKHVPALTYAAHQLLGKLAEARGDDRQALAAYDQALDELERLRGRLMIEFRADFLEDKLAVYEDAVVLCVNLGQPQNALNYAERAKSRALLELLAYRVDLGLSALDPADQELADRLVQLRAERDRVYRRWESNARDEMRVRGGEFFDADVHQAQAEVLEIEKQITETWHKLLIRNADYARDASLWQIRTEPVQPYLDEHTLLLEYYFAQGQIFAFLITQQSIRVERLAFGLPQLQHQLQLLWLNFRSAARSRDSAAGGLLHNARGVLERLYRGLVEPFAGELQGYSRLIVVPHGPLHYLPFHALFDGQAYLIERFQLTYLPAASFLRYCQETRGEAGEVLVAGHTYGGRLWNTLEEAQSIAELWKAEPLLEEDATIQAIQAAAPRSRLLHLATHGSFRADNPLFSGLVFADGWLTTLDIFNLRLQASLVTLSACETGRSVLGGGDELLGLMRAFLYAGAASLVLSQWAVEDRSSAILMKAFYRNLAAGQTKAEALRQAQLAFIRPEDAPALGLLPAYTHPYFWAPFFLAGDGGKF